MPVICSSRLTTCVFAGLMTILSAGVFAQATDPLAESRALAQNAETSQSLGKFRLAVDQLQQGLIEDSPDLMPAQSRKEGLRREGRK